MSRRVAILAAALPLLGPGCRHPAEGDDTAAPVEGTVVGSDLRGNAWFVGDLATGDTVATYTLDAVDPVCQGEENPVYCLLFQSAARTAADGRAEVAFTWSPLDNTDGDDGRDDLIGHYAAVDAETLELRWRLDRLDFSASGSDACPFDPADPCTPPETLSDAAWHACQLQMPHDLVVTGEDDVSLDAWLVDSQNSRLLDVRVPRDADCAVVERVLDADTPGWDLYVSVNSLVRWEDADGEHLLVSIKQTSQHDAGEAQMGGAGKGRIAEWIADGDGFREAWSFPPASTTEESFVNTPHGVARHVTAEGDVRVYFAHSLGRSNGWGTGTGGSVGVLAVEDGVPRYLYDLVLPGGEALRFPRDVEPLDDRRLLVTDSGCLGDACAFPTRAWIVRVDPDLSPATTDGVWTADHARQAFRDAEVEAGPLFDGANLLYSVTPAPALE